MSSLIFFLTGVVAALIFLYVWKVERNKNQTTNSDLEERIKRGPDTLKQLLVKHVFTHLSKVTYIDLNFSLDKVLQILFESKYSRYPVIDESFDNPVGVILVKDILKALLDKKNAYNLRDFIIPPIFLFKDQPLQSALKKMLYKRVHMAFVVDEHGCIDGIVTLEDIIERLIGEIYDETDPAPVTENLQISSNLIVPANLLITDLFDQLGLKNLPEKDETTVEGFIKLRLGDKLRENEIFEINFDSAISPFNKTISMQVKLLKRDNQDFFEISLVKN